MTEQPTNLLPQRDQTSAERALFKLELFMVFQMSGRDDDATRVFNEALGILRAAKAMEGG